jgi:mxaL protein
MLPPVPVLRPSWTTIVVFDITQSMNVEDVAVDGQATSRLDFAKQAARRMLRQLPCGSRVGWGAFSEYRSLLLVAPIEVCANYNDLLVSLARIDASMRWANASEITKGVFWALRAAKQEGSGANVFFLSDGHEAPPLNNEAMALPDELRAGDFAGAVVGIGDLVPRAIPKTDDDGRRIGFWKPEDVIQPDPDPRLGPGAPAPAEHLSALHEQHLQAIATKTGLAYIHLREVDQLGEAVMTTRLAAWRWTPSDLSWVLASIALLLLAQALAPQRLLDLRWPRRV